MRRSCGLVDVCPSPKSHAIFTIFAASAAGYDLSVTSALKTEGTQLRVEPMNLSMSADMGVFGGYAGVSKLLKDIAHKFPNQTSLTR